MPTAAAISGPAGPELGAVDGLLDFDDGRWEGLTEDEAGQRGEAVFRMFRDRPWEKSAPRPTPGWPSRA